MYRLLEALQLADFFHWFIRQFDENGFFVSVPNILKFELAFMNEK